MTVTTRRERLRAATCEEIKATARAHMARDGAALSLRAVASEMGLSSAAIYYYPNRDTLITALIVDAFGSLAAALGAASSADIDSDIALRLEATLLAYRFWALDHPAEYALVFGTPIPNYAAPAEVTAPEVRAAIGTIGALFGEAQRAGRLTSADSKPLPPALAARSEAWLRATGTDQPLQVLHIGLRAWGLAHGLVSLELFNHLGPIIGPADELYRHEIREMVRRTVG